MRFLLGKLRDLDVSWRLFGLLFALYAVTDILWHQIDARPPRWDESHNLMISQHCYESLQQGKWLQALSLKGISNTKTVFIPLLSALSYFVLGDSEQLATILVNLVSMALIFHCLLQLARDWTGRSGVGAVACLMFCTIPLVLVFCRYYQVDLPMTAAVCYSLRLCVALDKDDFAGNIRYLLLALVVAAGMMTKHMYAAYVFFPLLLLLLRAAFPSLRPLRFALHRRWRLVAALGVGVATGTAYHLLNYHVIQEQIDRSRNHLLHGVTGYVVPPAAWDVMTGFLTTLIVPMYAWLAVCGLAVVFSLVKRNVLVLYMLLAIVSGFLGVAKGSSIPLSYYFLPIAPLICLLGCGVLAVPLPKLGRLEWYFEGGRSLVMACCAAVLMLNYSEHTLGSRNVLRIALQTPSILFTSQPFTDNPLSATDYWRAGEIEGNATTLPYPHRWRNEEMLRVVADHLPVADSTGRKYRVGYFTDLHEWMCNELLWFKVRQLHLNRTIELQPMLGDKPAANSPPGSQLTQDYLLMKTGKVCKHSFRGTEIADGKQALSDRLCANDYRALRESGFTPLARFDLPDGSEGSVWASTNHKPSETRLLDQLASAKVSCPDLVAVSEFNVGGDSRRVLYHHPAQAPRVSEVRWMGIAIAAGSQLKFGITLDPETWQTGQCGDGVEFVAEVQEGERRSTLFRSYIDPKNHNEERHWIDCAVDLGAYAGKSVDLILTTLPGPAGDVTCDHAGWSGLRIVAPTPRVGIH